jgi:ParB family chromosome partitioning protein
MTRKSPGRAELASDRAGRDVTEIDVGLIEPSFTLDRLDGNPSDQAELVAAIGEHGQLSPILVRPHPEKPGSYQIVYGRRRLNAASELGRPVKAIIRSLSDNELVVAQGQENAVRADLSFIERALFSADLESRGFARETIMAALSVDKSGLSRLISVASKIPRDLIIAIGPAPAAGRPRWLDLTERLSTLGAIARARKLVQKDDFARKDTDERFAWILRQISGARPGKAATDLLFGGVPIGSIRRSGKATEFHFDTNALPNFDRFLEAQLPRLLTEWSNQQTSEKKTQTPPAAKSGLKRSRKPKA